MIYRIVAGSSMRMLIDDHATGEQHCEFTLERDSVLELTILVRGKIPQLSVVIRLMGENAQAHIKGMCILKNDASFIFETKQLHQAAHTISSCTIKSIVYDTSFVHYRGNIVVDAHAHYTNAKQINKNILMSSQARVTSIPSLEVVTKQVQCSHGSAVAHIDKELLFYMQSRGLLAIHAQRLLLHGFMDEIMHGMPLAMIEQIKEMIQ